MKLFEGFPVGLAQVHYSSLTNPILCQICILIHILIYYILGKGARERYLHPLSEILFPQRLRNLRLVHFAHEKLRRPYGLILFNPSLLSVYQQSVFQYGHFNFYKWFASLHLLQTLPLAYLMVTEASLLKLHPLDDFIVYHGLTQFAHIINQIMKKALQIIPNKIDKSITLIPENHYFSLIWLHGLGDSSAGFLDYFQEKQSPLFKGAKISLLQAPSRRVTINNGGYFNSWYDIKTFSGFGKEEDRYNFTEIQQSLDIIDKNVAKQINYWKEKGIKDTEQQICKRIFVGGFSQGCAMSLCYGLTSNRVVGGVIGFSGYLFEHYSLKNKGLVPILAYHGGYDDVLNYKWVKPIYDKHLKSTPNFDFRYIAELGHSVLIEQLSETSKWMLKRIEQSGIKP